MMDRLFGRSARGDFVSDHAKVVAISSGKGGTGKSFFATNLAIALSASRRRVALVDCDFGLGNVHLLLGVKPTRTLAHVVGYEATLEQILQPTAYGPALVAAGSGISRLANLTERDMVWLAQGLERLAAGHDAVLLDTAAGISPQCLLTLLVAQHVVLVTNPEIAALTDAYALIKCLARQPRCPSILVVVNRVCTPTMGQATFDRLANVSQRFVGCAIHYLGDIIEDPAVTQRRLGQPPLMVSHPGSETARCIRRIMENLERVVGLQANAAGPPEGILARLHAQLRPCPET